MAWIDRSHVVERLKGMSRYKKGATPALAFVKAARSLITVFDYLPGLGMAKSDMEKNANTLEFLAMGDSGITLQIMVEEDCSIRSREECSKLEKDGDSASCALVWLIRSLRFILTMMQKVVDDARFEMNLCVLESYKETLKPYHTFIIHKLFETAIKRVCPNRPSFLEKLAKDEDSAITAFRIVLESASPLITSIEQFLIAKNIERNR